MATTKLLLIKTLVAAGYPGPVLFKVDEDVLKTAFDNLEGGKIPNLKTDADMANVRAQLGEIPTADKVATTEAFKTAIADLSAKWVASAGGGTQPADTKPRELTRGEKAARTRAANKAKKEAAAAAEVAKTPTEVPAATTDTPTVDLSQVEATLTNVAQGLANTTAGLQEVIERASINDGTSAAVLAKTRQTARQVEIIGNGLNMLFQGVFEMELEDWNPTQGDKIDLKQLEDLGDDELSTLARDSYGAPSTILGSRASCIAWITSSS